MRSAYVAIGLVVISLGPFIAQSERPAQRAQRPPFSLMEELTLPSEQQRPWVREAGAKLERSLVPTANNAMNRVFTSYAVSMDMGPAVTGLFYLGRDLKGFGSKGDLVWEVRLSRMEGITDVFWVSAETRAVKSLLVPPSVSPH